MTDKATINEQPGQQHAIVLPLVVSAKVVWVRQYQDQLGYWRDATAHPCWSEQDAMIDLASAKIGSESLLMRVVKRVIVDTFVKECC